MSGIKANVNNKCIIHSASALQLDGTTKKSGKQNGYYVLEFDTEKGKAYNLSSINNF